MSDAITLQGITKTFGPKRAVDGLDLSIRQGELIGLIGPNGAGKTTTIRMIMSIIFPDTGTIQVLGKSSAVESKDRIGYLPEERGLYKKMKVGAFLEYVAKLKGIDGAGLQRRVHSWLDRVGLADNARKRCEELSKGMQQKVQFIAAIIHEPDLIILDEPFSGLDPVNAMVLRDLFHEQHKAGRTLIFSTHQMSQAEALCDRIVMIHQGKKQLDNTPAEIRNRFDPRSILVESLAPNLSEADFTRFAGVDRVAAVGKNFEVSVSPHAHPSTVMGEIASSIPCNRVQLVRPSLEDVFIEIVSSTAKTDDERAALATFATSARAARSDSTGD